MNLARCFAFLQCLGVAAVLVFGGGFPATQTQGALPQLPVVVSAAVPFYPQTALMAHIQGTVKIRVTTDGRKVSSLDAGSGPPILARAAADNIRTWRLDRHKPTTFLATFHYGIEGPSQCGVGNATVVLHLPTDISITARGVHTCDPVTTAPDKKR